MSRLSGHCCLLMFVVVFSCSSLITAAEMPDIVGAYRCVGDNGDGTKYEGEVTIAKKGDAFQVEWTIGPSGHVGIGLFDSTTFSVCWVAKTGGGGIAVYKLQKDGKTMSGKWTVLGGPGKVLSETLTKKLET